MKIVRKKVKASEDPNQNDLTPSEFAAMSALVDKSGLVSLTSQESEEASAESENQHEDEQPSAMPSWSFLIEKLPIMQVVSTKFSVFEGDTCQVVCEFLATQGVNPALFSWLQTPLERSVRIIVFSPTNEKIEEWNAKAVPVAFAAGELDVDGEDPWISTCQMSLKQVKIS